MKTIIPHRFTGSTLFEGDYPSVRDALIAAVAAKADLYGANLRGADLREADLGGADLYGADLRGADLGGAKLDEKTTLPTGETWKSYLADVLPALLTAGGRALADVATAGHWDCHDWHNCPMAAAFGASGPDGVPILLRPRAEQFIQFFDARLIPCPVTPASTDEVAS